MFGPSFYVIMFVIQGDLQGQFGGQIQVKFLTMLLVTNTNIYFELDKVFWTPSHRPTTLYRRSWTPLDSLWRLPIAPSTPSHRHLAPLRHPLTLTHCITHYASPSHFREHHLTPLRRLLTLCCRALAPLRRCFLTPPCCPKMPLGRPLHFCDALRRLLVALQHLYIAPYFLPFNFLTQTQLTVTSCRHPLCTSAKAFDDSSFQLKVFPSPFSAYPLHFNASSSPSNVTPMPFNAFPSSFNASSLPFIASLPPVNAPRHT